MKSSYGFWYWLLSASLTLLLSCMWHLRSKCWNRALHRLPPGPSPFPIIGSLHLLGPFPHQSFASLAKTFGPIMSLRLGSTETIVVSSASYARQSLTTHDRFFASRPRSAAGCLFYDHLNVGFTPSGPRWQFMRRVYTSNLFTVKHIESFRHIREEEMLQMLNCISDASQHGKPVNLRAFVSTLATNTMMRLVMSKRFSGHENDKSCQVRWMLEETFRMIRVLVISDFIPCLRWLDLNGFLKRMKTVSKAVDVFLEEVVNERRNCRKENPAKADGDFLDMLLSISGDASGGKMSDEAIKAAVLELLGAGTDTSKVTIEWGMTELLRNPSVMRKLEEEIETHVPACRKVKLTDLPNLHYLEAVVKETFRLHPVAPLLIPRFTMQPCKLGDYIIPEKARVYINVWAIGRDEAYWERPQHFWPERFVGSGIDVKGKDYELLPFGGGRRICPGLPLGLSTVQFTIASLVHSFHWALADCESPQDLDMREEMGITGHRDKPLMLHAIQRAGLQDDN